MTSFAKGRLAEEQAKLLLEQQGLCILETRYKTPFGEIDLIAYDKDLVVFTEVKYRRTLEKGLYSLSPQQHARNQNAALFFLQKNPSRFSTYRFDLVALSPHNTITHIPNIFL